MVKNFSTSSTAFINSLEKNTDDKYDTFKNAYYQDRLCTVSFFILILLIYKKCSFNVFNTLKKAVNNSVCSFGDLIDLKNATKVSTVNIDGWIILHLWTFKTPII